MSVFISAKDALKELSKCAPKPWCRRLLKSLIFDGRIIAYFDSGVIKGYLPISMLLDEYPDLNPIDGDPWLEKVIEKWGSSMKHRTKELKDGFLVEVTGYLWRNDGFDYTGPSAIPYGYFHYAGELDWDQGILSMTNFFPYEVNPFLFGDYTYLFKHGPKFAGPLFSWLQYDVNLTNMVFEQEAIELLSAVADGLPGRNPIETQLQTKKITPPKFDWDGALSYLIGLANTPDGLPSGHGAQSEIERTMSDWFISNTGNSPAVSEIRKRAQKIMQQLIS